MSNDLGQRYAAAHEAHYVTKELHRALLLYTALIDADPQAPEAGYSRAQLHNIVKSVVPEAELLAAQVELARECLEQADAQRAPAGNPGTRMVSPGDGGRAH